MINVLTTSTSAVMSLAKDNGMCVLTHQNINKRLSHRREAKFKVTVVILTTVLIQVSVRRKAFGESKKET